MNKQHLPTKICASCVIVHMDEEVGKELGSGAVLLKAMSTQWEIVATRYSLKVTYVK